MDFICDKSTKIEKKTNSKNKELEDAKTRMDKVYISIISVYVGFYFTLVLNYFTFSQVNQHEN